MKKEEVIEILREDESVDFDRERFDHLVDTLDVYHRRAGALILTEHGYSHSGIAQQLGVADTTAKNYLEDLEEKLGELVTQSKPKHSKNPELYPDNNEQVQAAD